MDESLERLGMETIDLLLIHSPNQGVPISETIAAMGELQRWGRVDHIGISNFSVEQTRSTIAASETPIVTNQVKYHPYHHQHDLLAYCIEHDVILTAYSPLARGRVGDDTVLREIGEQYGKTPAQVALRWLIQQPNVIAIPKAATENHRRENLDLFDFTLASDDIYRIFDIGGGVVDRVRELMR